MSRFGLMRRTLVGGALILAACIGLVGQTPAAWAETAVAPETNPPGDIPDDQVFITYAAPQGYSLKVPEGWARTDRSDGVTFADKYGRIDVTISPGTQLTAVSAKSAAIRELEKTGRAVKVGSVAEIKLPAGPAVRITFTSNSDPNSVTGKQIRLENERTLLAHDGKVATLTFSAPAGADNVDQWTLMAELFQWK